ncbi:MAG: hypothetical protein JRC77_02955, partial [Deltaproteobacteria bacterium]|nr:hypothetical protein [Deltaproteobacteria bacterium]
DLALNWNALDATSLKVVRITSKRFDPRALVGAEMKPLEAFRHFIEEVRQRSGATLLLDAEALANGPFPIFESLETYQREVLQING